MLPDSPDHVGIPPTTQSLPAELAVMILSPTISYIASSTSNPSAAFSTMTSLPSWNSTLSGDLIAVAGNGQCRLLGPFAVFVQAALGILALLSLVFKRWRERPQRKKLIWGFDASKQVVGSALLHVANLLMSMVSSGELKAKAVAYQANPCSFYLLNLAIDTTIGIPILVVLLRLLTHGFSLTPLANPPESIQSGNYGRPPKVTWWLKQCLIYFLGLLGMKACVFVIFQLCPWIVRVGDWALRWTKGNQRVQVFFVMLFFPVVMNAIQYYIIDSFIKDQKPLDHEPVPSDDEEENDVDDGGRSRRRRSEEVDDEGADESEAADKTSKNVSEVNVSEDKDTARLRVDPTKLDEYDPAHDGEGIGSSGDTEISRSSSKDSKAKAGEAPVKEA